MPLEQGECRAMIADRVELEGGLKPRLVKVIPSEPGMGRYGRKASKTALALTKKGFDAEARAATIRSL